MPVFTNQLRTIDPTRPEEALKTMANHIRYIQEQLEYTLTNLDSSNITELNTDETNIGSSTGGVSVTGTAITLKGANGETFEAGIPEGQSAFRFTVNGAQGAQIMYLTSDGELIITNHATIHIDGGEW
jgi:hypothetical protein